MSFACSTFTFILLPQHAVCCIYASTTNRLTNRQIQTNGPVSVPELYNILSIYSTLSAPITDYVFFYAWAMINGDSVLCTFLLLDHKIIIGYAGFAANNAQQIIVRMCPSCRAEQRMRKVRLVVFFFWLARCTTTTTHLHEEVRTMSRHEDAGSQ